MYGNPGETYDAYQARLGLLASDPMASARRIAELQQYLKASANTPHYAEGGVAGGFGASQLPGYTKYMNDANATSELADLSAVTAGKAPLARNPVARSATPGTSFLAPPVPAGPVMSSTGQDISTGPAQLQGPYTRENTVPGYSQETVAPGYTRETVSPGYTNMANPATDGLKRARPAANPTTGRGANNAYGQQPPSALENAATMGTAANTAITQAELGRFLADQGYGAGADLMRRAAATASGRPYFTGAEPGSQIPPETGPPLGSAPTPGLEGAATPTISDASLGPFYDRQAENILRGLRANEPVFAEQARRATIEGAASPQAQAARIKAATDERIAALQKQGTVEAAREAARIRAIADAIGSYFPSDPRTAEMYSRVLQSLGVDMSNLPPGMALGHTPGDPLGIR